MKISGLICEYNPFHNGHLYHINETRKNGATHIVSVMSGSFVQRGDVAIMDKLARARLAVRSGVDLVIELPVQFSLASAENFAAGAVWLLNCLGAVDELSFGSECGDIDKLSKALEMVDEIAETRASDISDIMEKGYTYPRALTSVLSGVYPNAAAIVSEPNNTLAIEYLRALKTLRSPMKPFTVRREGASHDSGVSEGGYASASYIRERILAGADISELTEIMPEMWAKAVAEAEAKGGIAKLERLERVMLYKLRMASPEEIAQISDIAQGLENRIYGARMAGSLEELFGTVKTKRYTMARIKRILLSLLIGITREDMTHMPPYGRILAFNERGREILAAAKGKAVLPYGSSLAKLSQTNRVTRRFAELEGRASDIYGLALDTVTSAADDYRAKIAIDLE
ncbi:MAG: nucleotidyltransferase family protein [Ruminococcus sp.]|nr:nucleotidyltransferase family protein [Ruminococcus sp.]